jgi:hypothetical protein
MDDAIQFKVGDTVSVFEGEGTHHVRGRRSTKFIGSISPFSIIRPVSIRIFRVQKKAPIAVLRF